MDRIHIGIDENGLGARLGPLVVTAVAARVAGTLPIGGSSRHERRHTHLLDDSKRLVSHRDIRLGEAWARAIVGPSATSPAAFLEIVGIDPIATSMKPCPSHIRSQCWDAGDELFTAPAELMADVAGCLASLREQRLSVCLLRSAWTCTRVLNDELAEGRHRFVVDLHSMERLVLSIQKHVGVPVDVVCGKVGGIADYPRFFGPLSGRLHSVIEQTKQRSTYEFAQLGRIAFEQDADANHPLVMIASLVGKYIRELFMARIGRRYANGADMKRLPSGYHDPVTNHFVEATSLLRKARRVPFDCFERRRNT